MSRMSPKEFLRRSAPHSPMWLGICRVCYFGFWLRTEAVRTQASIALVGAHIAAISACSVNCQTCSITQPNAFNHASKYVRSPLKREQPRSRKLLNLLAAGGLFTFSQLRRQLVRVAGPSHRDHRLNGVIVGHLEVGTRFFAQAA